MIPFAVINTFCLLPLHKKYMLLQACGRHGRLIHESHLSYFNRSLKEIIKMNLVQSFVEEVHLEEEVEGQH